MNDSNDSSIRSTISDSARARDCEGFKVYLCGDSDPVSSKSGDPTPSITKDAKEGMGGIVATTRGCANEEEYVATTRESAVRIADERIVILNLYVILYH